MEKSSDNLRFLDSKRLLKFTKIDQHGESHWQNQMSRSKMTLLTVLPTSSSVIARRAFHRWLLRAETIRINC